MKEIVAGAVFLVALVGFVLAGEWTDNLFPLLMALLGFLCFAFSDEVVPFFGFRGTSMSDWHFYPPEILRWGGAVMLGWYTWALLVH